DVALQGVARTAATRAALGSIVGRAITDALRAGDRKCEAVVDTRRHARGTNTGACTDAGGIDVGRTGDTAAEGVLDTGGYAACGKRQESSEEELACAARTITRPSAQTRGVRAPLATLVLDAGGVGDRPGVRANVAIRRRAATAAHRDRDLPIAHDRRVM